MENQNDRDIYVIPPNFVDTGTFFGGMFKARNVIEAGILAGGDRDSGLPFPPGRADSAGHCAVPYIASTGAVCPDRDFGGEPDVIPGNLPEIPAESPGSGRG